MAKTISWAPRAPEILARVQASSRQSWRRPDIERLFEVRRASAQTLMKLIGEVHLVGGTHVLDRSSLLAFLEVVLAAPSIAEGVRHRWLAVEPSPNGRGLRQLHTALPPELKSIMARDLPPQIAFAPGSLVISGAHSLEILEKLCLLAQALQNDLGTIQAMLDPPPPRSRWSRTSSPCCSSVCARTNTPATPARRSEPETRRSTPRRSVPRPVFRTARPGLVRRTGLNTFHAGIRIRSSD